MWEPTGKNATDKTTGAKLVEQASTETSRVRWEVTVDGVVAGYVHSYVGYDDKKAPGSRLVYSRKEVTRWAFTRVRTEAQPHPRTQHGWTTRAAAVRYLVAN